MSYDLHPSEKLVTLFRSKPWQGANPAHADFLFVGLDANYAPNIETTCPEVFDYLADGVNFWQTTGVHHPFRLRKYKGSGKRYHTKFAQIGFTPDHAEKVSFVELLHVPTTGVSQLTAADLEPEHVSFLENLFENGSARSIFMSPFVSALLCQTRRFPWLCGKELVDGDLKILRRRRGQTVYQMYHLSCYGWQSKTLDKQIAQIRRLIFV